MSKKTEKHIVILGLGPSLEQYSEVVKRLGGRSAYCDQVWAINALGNVYDCDLVIHMDDIRVQMIRAEADPTGQIAAMVKWLKDCKKPVMTSRAHPDFPALQEMPIAKILDTLGHDYMNNTGAWAVALAIFSGATKISIFGFDYTYPNIYHAEKGRANVEFWLGYAYAKGIKINTPATTTLMDSCCSRQDRLYGYDCVDMEFKKADDGSLAIEFTEKADLPTAAEIEARYDHSKPTHEQHRTLN